MASRTIDIDGPLHYVDYGGEGRPLVLVHGLAGSHVNWNAVGPALARHRRVLVPDLAGFGRTPLADRSARVDANARLLLRFVETVCDEPVTLVGNSMGGLISLLAAARDVQRVRTLVLVNAAHPFAWGVRPDALVTALFAAYMLPGFAELLVASRRRAAGPETLVRQAMWLCCADPAALPDALITAHVALERERWHWPGTRRALLQAARSTVFAVCRPGRLRRIADSVRRPTLLVHGDRDRLVPVGFAQAVARRHRWDLEVLHDVGHVPMLEVPDRFVSLVERWLERMNA